MDPCHPLYEADTCLETIVPLIATASGPLGTNAQYLFSLEHEIRNRGIQDDDLTLLASMVRNWLNQASDDEGQKSVG